MTDDKHDYAALLRSNLAHVRALRSASAACHEEQTDRNRLREWQSLRLARTHRDLLDSPRYGPAARFFLDDLYGPKDFSRRDDEVERIVPLMTRLLPSSALRSVAMAVGLDALTEELDGRMLLALRSNGCMSQIDDKAYAAAYRACGNHDQREQQIRLIDEIGKALAGLTRLPLLARMLRMMRGPAHLAGLAELHDFLERGFAAFKGMGNADEFLTTIRERETALMEHWFGASVDGIAR